MILGGAGIDDIGGSPVIPNDGDLQKDIDRATKIQEDARKCEEAQTRWKPVQGQHNQAILDLSQQMKDMGCGGGGCSKSKAKKCKAKGNEMKAECRALDNANYQLYLECPLMQEEVQPDGSIVPQPFVHADCS